MVSRLKVAIVYLQYDSNKYADSIPYVFGNLNKINSEKTYIIVDNKNCKKNTEIFENVHILGGDNTNWEFSGWQKGLNYVKKNINCDVVLFLNDSLRSYWRPLLEEKELDSMMLFCLNKNSLCGKIDSVNKSSNLSFLGYNTNSWICSNAFFGGVDVFNKINVDNTALFDIDKIVINIEKFLDCPDLSLALREHIYSWLSRSWHSKFNPKENVELFKNKTKAILNEKLLTAKAKEKGIRIQNSLNFRYE